MKKITTTALVAVLLGGTILQTGCFGGFKLTRKIWEFNNSLGNKFVKEIVFLAFNIVPIYWASSIIDAVILNLIEFWTGANPLAMHEGQIDTKTYVLGGRTVEISAMKNKFVIKEIAGANAGRTAELAFNPAGKTWALNSNGESRVLTKELENGTINVYMPNGEVRNYTADNSGFAQAQAVLSHQ